MPFISGKLYRAVWVVVCIFSSTAHAQPENQKIGYVDMKLLLDSAPQITLSRESIDRDFRPRSEAISQDEQRLLIMREQAQSDSVDLPALQNRIRNLELSINRRREDLRQEILYRRNAAIQQLEDEINLAVATIARTRNYDLIISSPVIYANDSVDLTQAVLDFLQDQAEP